MKTLRLVSSLAPCLAVLLLAGCGDGPEPRTDPVWYDDLISRPAGRPTGWPDAAACTPMGGATGRGGDLVVALGEPVTPDHAPVPFNDAERVVFAGCYETLVRVSCTGTLAPGLAASWRRLDDGRRWQLTLRKGAVFWDGRPVTAADVIAAWVRNLAVTRDLGRPCPGLWLEPGRRGVVSRGPRTLEIRLPEPQDDLPRLLAHPALAVAARREGWLWPVGSGPCRLAADADLPLPDLVCRPNLHHPEPPAWRSLTLRIVPDADPRDLLPDGVDLAVLRDQHARAFHAEVPGVRWAPLPWDRKYVLLATPPHAVSPRDASLVAAPEATVAESRRTDRLTFRACRQGGCPQLHGPTVSVLTPPVDPDPALDAIRRHRLHHAAGDPDAAALAARVAAHLFPEATVHPLPPADLARAVQDAEGLGAVIRLDACYPAPCLTLAALLAHGPWLQSEVPEASDDPCEAAHALLAAGRAVPLADTRGCLVWRGPLAGLRLAHDGTPLLATLGVAAAETAP